MSANNIPVRLVRIVLNTGPADPNAKDNNGQTPLHCACMMGHFEIAKLLAQHGANVNVRDNRGKAPFHEACAGGHWRVAALLIEHGAELQPEEANDTNQYGLKVFRWACKNGDAAVASKILEKGLEFNVNDEDGQKLLFQACHIGFAEVVKLLLTRRGTIIDTTQGAQLLHVACKGNHPDVVSFLVRQYPWLVVDL